MSKQKLRELKKAVKTFKFWTNVLLETELTNDVNHRKELMSAKITLNEFYKEQKNSNPS